MLVTIRLVTCYTVECETVKQPIFKKLNVVLPVSKQEWCNNPQDDHPYSHLCEILKSYRKAVSLLYLNH